MPGLKPFLARFAVPGLIRYVLAFQVGFYILALAGFAHAEWADRMVLEAGRVRSGEIWRLATFLFIPPADNLLFFLCHLYFTWLMGQGLERAWGAAGFNGFYWTGAAFTIGAAFAVPGRPVGNGFLHLSMFLAFARIYPDFTILLFFVVPVPVRYLGYLAWIFLALGVAAGDSVTRLAIAAGLANYSLFLGRGHLAEIRDALRRGRTAPPSAAAIRAEAPVHHCAACAKSERDGRDLEFRVCTACAEEWCMEHLAGHACQAP